MDSAPPSPPNEATPLPRLETADEEGGVVACTLPITVPRATLRAVVSPADLPADSYTIRWTREGAGADTAGSGQSHEVASLPDFEETRVTATLLVRTRPELGGDAGQAEESQASVTVVIRRPPRPTLVRAGALTPHRTAPVIESRRPDP